MTKKRDRRPPPSRIDQMSRPRQLAPLGPLPAPRGAGVWPLHEVWLTSEWRSTGGITQAIVARRSAEGHIAAGVFLIDLACLGLKNAFARSFRFLSEYETLRDELQEHQPMEPADLNLVAKIIREATAYAQKLGISPHPDAKEALQVLGQADPDACPIVIPLGGLDGMPFFMPGPYDDVDRIIDRLTKAVGRDGFIYVMPLDPGEL